MIKYAKIENETTKSCIVGLGNNAAAYQARGMTLQEVEQGPDGNWYLSGFAPVAPPPDYQDLRRAAYPTLTDQLDMIYWDQVNGTTIWRDTIAGIKAAYPKPV